MADFVFSEVDTTQWMILCFCAVMVGISKTGVPGVGILNVPLLALLFPAKASTGLLLPMLAFADIFAVAYYRRHAQWSHIIKLLPPALAGIAAGSVVIRHIDNTQLKPIIGIIILSMLALNYWRDRRSGDKMHIPTHWSFAVTIGFFAGVTTQLANAAGPIMVIYLLAMRFDKNEFIGTGAWYFLILNWLKIPMFVWDGRITLESVKADLLMCPLIIVGVVAGIVILKRLPQKWFNIIVQVLVLAAAVKLVMDFF
ncbi:MAG: sulfite exporter TauE/SafE family protein [Planctomycetota bacterium]